MAGLNKALVALVAGMGVIILLGFGALIAGLILKATEPESALVNDRESNDANTQRFTSAKSKIAKIALPEDHRIENIGFSGSHIILHTNRKDGPGGVFIVDGETGTILKRFEIGTGP